MTELQSIMEFEENDKWFHENIDKLRINFVNKFVAVKDKHVIEASSDIEDLVKKIIGKHKEKPNEILIEFINTPDFKMLL